MRAGRAWSELELEVGGVGVEAVQAWEVGGEGEVAVPEHCGSTQTQR